MTPSASPTPAPGPAPSPAPGPAWSDADLAQNPHLAADKADKVRGMFAAIARSYDLNNRVHSLWQDQAWRRFAVKQAEVQAGEHVLDVACGTGDLTQAFATTPAARVVGCDFTPQMLDLARDKQARDTTGRYARIEYAEGDATRLAFPDSSFDVVSIAFGIRNVTRPEAALAEFFRVLRPKGRLIILEFTNPSFAPMRWFNSFYCGWVMPRTATLISHDTSGAYKYLPKSVGAFMSKDDMIASISRAGFAQPSARSLSLGICACYRAVRP